MLVEDVHGPRAHGRVGHEDHFRVLGLDGIVEQPVVVLVDRPAVLVADLHVLQLERGRVARLARSEPHLLSAGPLAYSMASRASCDSTGTQLVVGHAVLVGHAAVDHEQRLRADVFAKLQILVIAQAVGRRYPQRFQWPGRWARSPMLFFQRKALCRRLPST